jgi:prepilin-type N-terminal cleavage/methylation domain-containing protein
MNMNSKHLSCKKGFTLLEIIVTLILVGISAAIMFPVMGTNLTRSAEPVNRVANQYILIQEMDKLIGIYREDVDADTLESDSDDFDLGGFTGFKSTQVDLSPNILADETYYLERNVDATEYFTSGNDGKETTHFLLVTLAQGDQKISAIFTQ